MLIGGLPSDMGTNVLNVHHHITKLTPPRKTRFSMFKVIKCERVDNPFYKALVENPCIRTEKEFDTEKEANEFINADIDEYLAKHDGNDIKAIKIELEWQVGASIKDNSRFGGLNIYYQKRSW